MFSGEPGDSNACCSHLANYRACRAKHLFQSYHGVRLRAFASKCQGTRFAGCGAIDQTPDSEKVRRCLLREAEDKAPVDVREAIEIQPDKHLGSNRIALNDLVPL